jgi:hypothetical protein
MPRMLAAHEDTARGGADVVARVVLRELHPVLGKLVEIRRANLRLAKRADVAVTEIVGEEEDDVGARCGREGCDRQQDGG